MNIESIFSKKLTRNINGVVKAEEKDNRNSAVQRPDEQRGSYPDRRSRQLFGHSARRLAARAGCRRPVKIKKFPEKKVKAECVQHSALALGKEKIKMKKEVDNY